MKLQYKIIGVCWVFSLILAVFITIQYKDGQFSEKELYQAQIYNQQLTEKTEQFKAEQLKLIDENNKKLKALEKVNTDLESKWRTAKNEQKVAVEKYKELVKNGWVLKDPVNQCNLSNDFTSFLVNFASEADLVVQQLKTTQKYAMELRQVCSGKTQ